MTDKATFTEEPQCEACLSKDVSLRYVGTGGERLICTCERCGFSWVMEPAWEHEDVRHD